MIDPRTIAGAAYWGPKIIKDGLQPSNQFVETQPVLTREESQLFGQLREGGPCVVCGIRGAGAVNVCLCKFVNKSRSGHLFWKKETHYYCRKPAFAPLCAKHYHEAKATEAKGCLGALLVVLVPALFSYLMLLLKQHGHCVIFDGNVLTVIVWFIVGFVGIAILLGNLEFFEDKGVTFASIWECGSLQRLLALGWFKCDGEVGEDQLDEAKRKGGV